MFGSIYLGRGSDALASKGTAIVLISSEFEEVIRLSERVLVMRAGRVVTELRDDEITQRALLHASFGTDEGLDDSEVGP